MGALELPASGSVYLDSNCLIYSVEKIEPYCNVLQPVWQKASSGEIQVVCSELTLLETRVKPLRERDVYLIGLYWNLLTSEEVNLCPIDQAVLLAAVDLRVEHGFKTPDAIHAATSVVSGCSMFITNDPHFAKLKSIAVILSEVVS